MTETVEQLTELCRRFGAEHEQAEVIARQLLKRSHQLSQERQCPQPEALDYLLRVMVAGRSGEVYEGSRPGTPSN